MRSITITIEATENNLQRLAALMLFADRLDEDIRRSDDGPLPWDEPAGASTPAPEAEIDYNVVRRTIVSQLERYVKLHGVDKAREVLRSFGAEKLTLIPVPQLLPLYEAFAAALPAEPENKT